MKLLNESSEYLQSGYKKSIGFTKIANKNGKLSISHGGNMGNSIKDSVNPNLKIAGMPTIEQLKKKFPKFKEDGSPDYMYSIEFTLPKNESALDDDMFTAALNKKDDYKELIDKINKNLSKIIHDPSLHSRTSSSVRDTVTAYFKKR